MIIKNREYIKVDLIEVKQKDVRFFVGKMSADDLLGIYMRGNLFWRSSNYEIVCHRR